jgi:hypothetical protein
MGTPCDREFLVEHLVADAQPVRRLWPPSVRFGLWLLLGLVVVLVYALSGLRPDLAVQLREPAFVLEVGLFFATAGLLAALSLAAAVPGREPTRRQYVVTMVLAAAIWVLPIRYPAEASLALERFLELAAGCQRQTILLALLPWAALLVALRRGAPLAGAVSGSLAGAAAFLLAAATMRLACPADERFHLLVGHGLPALVGVAVSAIAGGLWLSRWRTVGPRAR